MSAWIWVLIPLVVIIGGYIIDYQQNKLKWQSQNSRAAEEMDEMQNKVDKLRKRIENLEAIAAGEPESFNGGMSIDIPDPDRIKRDNENIVAKMARNKGN
jgi:hypothetical protein